MAAAISALAASPLAERYALTVIATHRPGSRLRRAAVFARSLVSLVRFLLATRAPRVVHVHATVRGSLHRKSVVVAISRAAGAIVVLHVHAGAGDLITFHERLGPIRRRALTRVLGSCDRVLAVSRASADVLERRFRCPPVTLVSNPLPCPLPERIEYAPDSFGVLFLGGFANPVKGATTLLEALPVLRAACPQARVTFAGPGNPPGGALPAGAISAGWLDQAAKARELAAAAIVVVPSTSEGLPIVLLEAMAHGKAIVATRVGAIPDVLEDGRDGVLVAPAAPLELGAALAALAADPERQRRLGEAAHRHAADFTPERVARQIDELYRELLADAGRAQ
jgi:glycosyltransferase involved in cell wall biosynthesis